MRRFSVMVPLSCAILVIPLIVTTAEAQQVELKALAESNAAFAFELYQNLREAEGNLIIAPYSISTALAMTYAGARDQTEKEMVEVLHFPQGQPTLHRTFSALQSHINEIRMKGQIDLHTANSLWYQEDFQFLNTFVELLKTFYSSGLYPTDFEQHTEDARLAINAWVAKETANRIRDLFKPGIIDPVTVLVLCNATYFKGNWASRFDAGFTREADFYITPDRTVQVPMMTQMMKFRWKAFDRFQAIELPYDGDDLSMVVLLPNAVDGLTGFEQSLTANNVVTWMNELAEEKQSEIAILLPKFSTTCQLELAEILAAMGMPSAFRNADFSGMTDSRDLFISNVIHKTFIEVNEEGSEAAASTGIVMKRGGAMFRVNHPFLFLIRENKTGSILFLGRITDPTG